MAARLWQQPVPSCAMPCCAMLCCASSPEWDRGQQGREQGHIWAVAAQGRHCLSQP